MFESALIDSLEQTRYDFEVLKTNLQKVEIERRKAENKGEVITDTRTKKDPHVDVVLHALRRNLSRDLQEVEDTIDQKKNMKTPVS